MAKYKVDLDDYYFTLFDVLDVQNRSKDFEQDDLIAIIEEYNKFMENEFFPTRQEADEVGVKLTPEGVKVPECMHKSHKAFYENGWFGLTFPEDEGGIPVPESILTACNSILCGANLSHSLYVDLSHSALRLIRKVGNDEQRKAFSEPMISGRWGGTMCLTEPGAGSDVGSLRTTATPNGDGTYNIKGVKCFISSGENDLHENIVHLVLARTPDGEAGTKGISLFIVPRYKINDDGSVGESNDVKCTKVEEKMGIHASATCELTFGGNDGCVGQLIGKEFEGMQNMFIMMNEARLFCSLHGEGPASMSTSLATQYAHERSQFKQELAKFPDVKRMLLKMRAMSRGLRALCLYIADLIDEEHENPAAVSSEIGILTPICKGYCTDEGYQVTIDAIQVHGGYGYCTEYGIEQFARDSKIATIYEGTNGIQAIDFVLRKILKDQGKAFMMVGSKISETLKSEDSRHFNEERSLIIESMKKSEEIMKRFAFKAQNNKVDEVLQHATDFMSYCGNIMVAWRLLEAACIANKKISSNENPAKKEFYESKIADFKVFCQHYLTRNIGIAHRILEFEQNISVLEV